MNDRILTLLSSRIENDKYIGMCLLYNQYPWVRNHEKPFSSQYIIKFSDLVEVLPFLEPIRERFYASVDTWSFKT